MFKMTKKHCNVVMAICDALEPVKTYIAFEVGSIPTEQFCKVQMILFDRKIPSLDNPIPSGQR